MKFRQLLGFTSTAVLVATEAQGITSTAVLVATEAQGIRLVAGIKFVEFVPTADKKTVNVRFTVK